MSRAPDYKIHALNKHTNAKGEIGAGWIQPNGSIQIAFNPYVVVPVGKEFVISLFPNTPKPEAKKQQEHIPTFLGQPEEDEIPF